MVYGGGSGMILTVWRALCSIFVEEFVQKAGFDYSRPLTMAQFDQLQADVLTQMNEQETRNLEAEKALKAIYSFDRFAQ